ncbi:MAG: DUF695 domain-containing protein [Pseudomonadota bacterium]
MPRYLMVLIFWCLFTSASVVATPKGGVQIEKTESSDVWGMYISDMGGHPAMTVFDDGISESIDDVELANSIKIKLYLDDVRNNGFPTSAEGERLMRLGPIIESAITESGGLFLGRVTTNSVRWNIGLVPNDVKPIENALLAGSEEHDFRYEVFVEPDPDKAAYWQDLYPTDDDRQVMVDMEVLRSLEDHGDDQNAERPVEHWVYFDRKKDAESFAKWADQTSYKEIDVSRQKNGLLARSQWLVRLTHNGTMRLNDITHHTLKLSRRAREHNGLYDGWETQVMSD